MSYRDDSHAQFDRLEAVMRENRELRHEIADLRNKLATCRRETRASSTEILLAALLTGPALCGVLYGIASLF